MRDPINPADIRVGDRVERVCVSGDHETIERFTVESLAHRAVSSGRLMWGIDAPRTGTVEWYLLDRPDPLAEVVEVAAKTQWTTDNRFHEWADATADQSEAYRVDARAVVAAISERWELVERGQS